MINGHHARKIARGILGNTLDLLSLPTTRPGCWHHVRGFNGKRIGKPITVLDAHAIEQEILRDLAPRLRGLELRIEAGPAGQTGRLEHYKVAHADRLIQMAGRCEVAPEDAPAIRFALYALGDDWCLPFVLAGAGPVRPGPDEALALYERLHATSSHDRLRARALVASQRGGPDRRPRRAAR